MLLNAPHSRHLRSLTFALPVFACTLSGAAVAVDAVGGSARNTNVVVPGTPWTVLTSVSFANTTRRYCVATASADALRPSGNLGAWTYNFTVSDSPNPPLNQGQERTLEFFNQFNALDNSRKEITTTGGWPSTAVGNPGYFTVEPTLILFGTRTLYFLARKTNAAFPNLTVDDASMTVVCTDSRLAPPPPIVIDPQLVPGTVQP